MSSKLLSYAKEAGVTLVEAGRQWVDDDSSVLAAALAYYALFSLVPLLIVLSVILAFFYGQQDAQQNINEVLGRYFGAETTSMIKGALSRSMQSAEQGVVASIAGSIAVLFGASKVFLYLQDALNKIWNVRVKEEDGVVSSFIKERLFSFGMVLGLAFLLLVSLVLSTAIEMLSTHMSSVLPGADIIWTLAHVGLSLLVYTLLFGLLLKFVPDVQLQWRGVVFGATVTAVLFLIGQWALSLYLTHTSPASTYGAAGSLVTLILWMYYSAQVVFYGAELTQVSAVRQGWEVRPSDHAVWGDGAYLEEDVEASNDRPSERLTQQQHGGQCAPSIG